MHLQKKLSFAIIYDHHIVVVVSIVGDDIVMLIRFLVDDAHIARHLVEQRSILPPRTARGIVEKESLSVVFVGVFLFPNTVLFLLRKFVKQSYDLQRFYIQHRVPPQ